MSTVGAGAEKAESPLERMAHMVRIQSQACAELGSPLYAALLDAVADDVLAGGPALDVLAGHEADPGPSALALRLMGAVHRLVLERAAPGLALFYPSVGGTAGKGGPGGDHHAWPALRQVLIDHREELRAGLEQPPQTNEVGRAGALLGGLLHVVAQQGRPVHLAEIGASAGLNLRADAYRYDHVDGGGWGPVDSPVRLVGAWAGRRPPVEAPLEVRSRSGCDLAPVDVGATEGRLRLTAYVWADLPARFERLRGALAVEGRIPVEVRAQRAVDFVGDLSLTAGVTTVLWHSVMWQYLGAAERERVLAGVEALGAAADDGAGFAHLHLEPRPGTSRGTRDLVLTLRLWPGGAPQVLAAAPAHGLPTTWH